eukprot:1139808-Pelagomonas_calceolata.AAC.2
MRTARVARCSRQQAQTRHHGSSLRTREQIKQCKETQDRQLSPACTLDLQSQNKHLQLGFLCAGVQEERVSALRHFPTQQPLKNYVMLASMDVQE